MWEDAESLRRALSGARPTWNAAGFPAELRARVGRWLSARRAEGAPWSALSEALGIAEGTARRWADGGTSGGFVSVQLDAPALRREGPVLITPRGYRVEGLDAAMLHELLERLG